MDYSKYQKKPKMNKNRSHIPVRLNILFFIVFTIFVTLILSLAYLQIVKGDEFVMEIQRTEMTYAQSQVPRGEIFDAHQRKLVYNEPRQTITYTRGNGVTALEMGAVAYDLSAIIEMPFKEVDGKKDYHLSERDLKDYFVAISLDEINNRLSDEERKSDDSKIYEIQLSKVTSKDINAFDDRDKNAAAIFKRMNSGYALNTIHVKKTNVTDEEVATVSEELNVLPGVGIGVDWERTYPQGSILRSVLGSVTSEEQGIPEQNEGIYLASGYSLNDRVGQSNLEQEYETVLKGTKTQSYTETNINGEITNQIEKYPGMKGHNLVLNIDVGFQAALEKMAIEFLENNQQGLNDSVYMVAMDPNDGDILGMVGKKMNLENRKISDDALGTYTRSFEAGSSVKGATILAGMMDGVLNEDNNVIEDSPLFIAGTPSIRSVFNPNGSEMVDDITALEVSSNIYMTKIAMRMGGIMNYENGEALNMNGQLVVDKMRYYFSQFGLGVPTGIDLPNEQTGFKGEVIQPGQALYYSFGQFDSYTPMQLAQYISTIANGGTRYAPQLVSEIRGTNEDGSIGEVLVQRKPRILNTIQAEEQEISRVQKGMYEVVNGSRGTAQFAFNGAPYKAAGKTGTAETVYFNGDHPKNGEEVLNMVFTGYAPFDNPEIAIAVIAPHLPRNTTSGVYRLSRQMLDAYFQVGEFDELNQTIAKEYPIEGIRLPEEVDDSEEEVENSEEVFE